MSAAFNLGHFAPRKLTSRLSPLIVLVATSGWTGDAPTVKVLKDPGDRIRLQATSCDLLDKQVQALSKWTLKTGEKIGKASSCECEKQDSCVVEVTHVTPALVRQFHNFSPDFEGPNCWNAALVTGKLIPALRFSDPDEMSFWLKSPLCRERGIDEAALAGDIIAIRTKAGSEDHGFVYLTDQLSFSKNGYSNDNPYLLQSVEGVFATYGVKPECRRVRGKGSASCDSYANYFECDTFDNYIQKHKVPIPKAWNDLSCQICVAERIVSQMSLHGKTPGAIQQVSVLNLREIMRDTFAPLRKLAIDGATSRKKQPEVDRLLWKSLVLRIDAALEQLNRIDGSDSW